MSELFMLDPAKYLPERFGYFTEPSSDAPSVITFTPDNQVNHEAFCLQYRLQMLGLRESFMVPVCISARDTNDSVPFLVLDLDKHNGKANRSDAEMQELYKRTIRVVSRFEFASENSGGETGGIKIWILFNRVIPLMPLVPFISYLVDEFADIELEVFPSHRKGMIRLPGAYKTRDRYSFVMEAGKACTLSPGDFIDTYDKMSNFLLSGMNDADEFLAKIDNMNLPSISANKSSITAPARVPNRIGVPTILTGMDGSFKVIWEHVTGLSMPEVGKNFCCPFHTDANPSARINPHPNEPGKLMFCCFSGHCDMRSWKDSAGRDAFDILHYHIHGDLKITQKSAKACRKYLTSNILLKLFYPHVHVDCATVTIDEIAFAESIFEQMHNPENDTFDIKKDEQGVPCYYDPSSMVWAPIFKVKDEPPIVRHIIDKNIETAVGKAGKSFLGKNGIDTCFSIVKSMIGGPGDILIERPMSSMGYIPCQNGVLDIQKWLARDEGALEKHKKGNMIKGIIGTHYDPKAINKMYVDTVHTYLPDDGARKVFQEFHGVSLIPTILVSQMCFCIGTGGNGKNTVLNPITWVFGPLCSKLPFHQLGDQFRASMLYGSLLNVDPDASMAGIDQASFQLFKIATGESPVILERKFGDPFEYSPKCKYTVAANDYLETGIANKASDRRIIIIDFKEKIQKIVGGYASKIAESEGGLPGILNWLLEGVRRFYNNGMEFSNYQESIKSKKEMMCGSDPVYAYVCSLFETELNDPIKFPQNNPSDMRLSNQQLQSGVTCDILFMDYCIFIKQSKFEKKSSVLRITRTKFYRMLGNMLSDNLLPEYVQKHISKRRSGSKRIYTFDLEH